MDKAPALLGLLVEGPTHGYDLKQRYDAYFGGDRPLAYGQVYATLARMIRDGLIVALGEQAGGGPDRKRYGITPAGRKHLEEWLSTPEPPSPSLQSNLFAKTILALLLDAAADELLDIQRKQHLARMREMTALKATSPLLERLAIDHELFHLEADLRWIDMTSARLTDMRKELNSHG